VVEALKSLLGLELVGLDFARHCGSICVNPKNLIRDCDLVVAEEDRRVLSQPQTIATAEMNIYLEEESVEVAITGLRYPNLCPKPYSYQL
jgi:hypothetical protein